MLFNVGFKKIIVKDKNTLKSHTSLFRGNRAWSFSYTFQNIRYISMNSQKYNQVLADIGTRLAELREQKGYTTIKAFTLKYNLPEIQYWRMEKGKANITLKSLVNVLSIHKMSLQEFFCLVLENEDT